MFRSKENEASRMKYILMGLLCLLPFRVWTQERGDTIAGKTHRIAGVDVVSVHETNKVSTTAPVQIIGSEQMLKLGMLNMSDALKNMAGITIRDYGGAGGMKTVSVRGIGARHTAVTYDGIALSDCQTGEIDLSRYSLNDVRQLSLTIGDGDNILQPARNIAAAATLNIQIRNEDDDHPDDAPPYSLAARLTMGSWGLTNPSFYYGQRIGKRFSLSAIGEYTYAENDYPFTLKNISLITRERRTNSRMSAGHGEINVRWTIHPQHLLTGKIYYYDNKHQLPGIVHYYTHDNDETLHERNAFAQIHYQGQLSHQWQLMANGKFNWAESKYHNGQFTGSITDTRYLQNESYGSLAALYQPHPSWSFAYAADYIFNKFHNQAAALSGPNRHGFLQALSAKYTLPRLSVIVRGLASVYVDHSAGRKQSSNTHRLSPSVSASYQLFRNHDVFVRLMWKDVFRMPTFNELYYYHIGTNDLKPEKSQQWNLGITWKSRQYRYWQATATLDGYINRVTDKLVAIPFNMFVWRMMNLAKVKTTGIDATIQFRWNIAKAHAIEMTSNYSLQKAENRSNPNSEYYENQIAYTPEHTWSASMGWENPWVNISLSAHGMSERWTTNEHADGTRMGGFTEMNVNLWRTIKWNRTLITLRGSILNLFDKQYDIVVHYPMPGRSWRLTAEVNL